MGVFTSFSLSSCPLNAKQEIDAAIKSGNLSAVENAVAHASYVHAVHLKVIDICISFSIVYVICVKSLNFLIFFLYRISSWR
jgi:hypothetical protein